jgi:exodeoxyribonuclease V alpha subunit
VHLSARIAWHDSAWNGRICRAPRCNSSCIVHDYIRNARNDDTEDALAGEELADLSTYIPPCSYDAATYGERGYAIEHHDPVEGRGLPAAHDTVEPYSTFITPYRWMREEYFADISQAEGLKIRASASGKSHGWVTEDDRQRQLLKAFWDKVKPRKSLVFYYCKDANPIDDDITRLVIGVGRVAEIGHPTYFGQHPKFKGQFPVWARRVTQAWPSEGVRIPYQEYLEQGLNAKDIACVPPPSQTLSFSYVGEHVSDGVAAMTLDRVIRSVERVRDDGILTSYDSEGALRWLNEALDEVWSNRGAYPGIGALLRVLGFESGIHYQYSFLSSIERRGEDPWHRVRSILAGLTTEANSVYAVGLAQAGEKWRAMRTRHDLMDILVRFELTTEQIADILSEVHRIKRGIKASLREMIDNPYLLAEQDTGTDVSEPISLDIIDQGIRTEGAASVFGNPWSMPQDDKRRVRAVAHSVLSQAAGSGHTFLPLATLLSRVQEHFPERRQCRPDEEVILSSSDFFEKVIDFDEVEEVPVAALRSLRLRETEVSNLFERLVRKQYSDAPAVDWESRLRTEFGRPKTERERSAIAEKTVALESLYRQRLSVLVGGAGVGKTKALKVFLEGLIASEGMQPMLLLAPTGKARVRLAESTRRKAQTIHQVLRKQELIGPRLTLKHATSKPPQRASTIIIDEASMPSVDLLAALLKAIEPDAIRRLIFVGDPHQLPPIGPGRPFSELIDWLRENAPQCVAKLSTCMRTTEVDGAEAVSPGLELASTYRDDAHPTDDAILSRLARGEPLGDVEVGFWNSPTELRELIKEKLKVHAQISEGDFVSFNRSLGFDTEEWEKAESWQILSPTRGEPHGTRDINRLIQSEFRGGMLAYARNPYNKMPRPFGDEEIVRGDKVINIANDTAYCKPSEKGLSYLANGEIAMVTRAYKSDYGDKLTAVFTTQRETTYFLSRNDARDRLELAYALTVHKAQGSDFDTVFLILPQEARTLSRELLYTALTRFRKHLVIFSERDIAPLLRLRAADLSDARQRCTRLFSAFVPTAILPNDDPRTPIYAKRLRHRTGEGIKVRSKSEVIVAYALERAGLQPHYETPLYAANGDPKDFRLPDFTIMYDGETWYWEHLGMLSNARYRRDWEEKKAWYQANGYLERVITSEDGPDGSIHADTIEKIAKQRIFGHS